MKNKNVVLFGGLAIILCGIAVAGYLMMHSSGKNIVDKSMAILSSSWKNMFSSGSQEITSADQSFFDENASDTPIDDGSTTISAPSDAVAPIAPKKKVITSKKSVALDVAKATVTSSSTLPDQKAAVGESISTGDESSSSTSVDPPKKISACAFPASSSSSQKILLNEIAWMGSPPVAGESASDAAKREWIEIKNNTDSSIDLSGWQILNASGKLKFIFSSDDYLDAGEFAVIERGSSSSAEGSVKALDFFSGSLTNTGDVIALVDPDCAVSDFLDASNGWPGGNNSTKQTLERNAVSAGWHTSVGAGGTPGAENSLPPQVSFVVSVVMAGDGTGTLISDPSGMRCVGNSCKGSYPSGTLLSINIGAGQNLVFSGWSGPCSGQGACVFNVSGPVSAVATLHGINSGSAGSSGALTQTSPAPVASSSDPASDSTPLTPDPGQPATSTSSSTPINPSAPDHVVIAVVQTIGASTTNDFVKIYNPMGAGVDIGGWRLRKRSSTGTDASIKVFPGGSTISDGGYFVWANSTGGFSESMAADVSSTETLSADNSVALVDASGTVIDAVAWGNGSGQYGEGAAYPTNPAVNQLLKRIFMNGVIVDTNNNALDFMLQ